MKKLEISIAFRNSILQSTVAILLGLVCYTSTVAQQQYVGVTLLDQLYLTRATGGVWAFTSTDSDGDGVTQQIGPTSSSILSQMNMLQCLAETSDDPRGADGLANASGTYMHFSQSVGQNQVMCFSGGINMVANCFGGVAGHNPVPLLPSPENANGLNGYSEANTWHRFDDGQPHPLHIYTAVSRFAGGLLDPEEIDASGVYFSPELGTMAFVTDWGAFYSSPNGTIALPGSGGLVIDEWIDAPPEWSSSMFVRHRVQFLAENFESRGGTIFAYINVMYIQGLLISQ